MQGVEITEFFDEPLELAPTTITGEYMPQPKRNHDPRVDVRGTVAFPLTERIASDLAEHGEEWTRAYHLERGVPAWELNILIAGAKASA